MYSSSVTVLWAGLGSSSASQSSDVEDTSEEMGMAKWSSKVSTPPHAFKRQMASLGMTTTHFSQPQ